LALNLLFTPDFSKIFDGSAWVDAYGQVFFSLSVAFAIMITYSSYLPKTQILQTMLLLLVLWIVGSAYLLPQLFFGGWVYGV